MSALLRPAGAVRVEEVGPPERGRLRAARRTLWHRLCDDHSLIRLKFIALGLLVLVGGLLERAV